MGVRCNRRLARRVQGRTPGSADLARARRGRAGLIRAHYNQLIRPRRARHGGHESPCDAPSIGVMYESASSSLSSQSNAWIISVTSMLRAPPVGI